MILMFFVFSYFNLVVYLIGQSFIMLLIPRAMQGISSALIEVSGMAMMANMIRDEETRIRQIGFCLGGMALGVLIGYPFGSLFYQWFGKTILFSIIAVSILLLLGISYVNDSNENFQFFLFHQNYSGSISDDKLVTNECTNTL